MDLVGLELVLGVLRVVLLRGNTSALASPARARSDSATRATASGQRASARLEKRDDQIADGACDPLLGQRDLERLVERLRRRLLVVDEHLPRRRAVCRAREFTSRARNYTHLHRRRRRAKGSKRDACASQNLELVEGATLVEVHDEPVRDGGPPLKLPTIRKLAARGTAFQRAYVPSPLCAPSRASLASGREYDETGVPTNNFDFDPLAVPTIYQALREHTGAG